MVGRSPLCSIDRIMSRHDLPKICSPSQVQPLTSLAPQASVRQVLNTRTVHEPEKASEFMAALGLEENDLEWLLKATKVMRERIPPGRCWDLEKINHAFFHGFTIRRRQESTTGGARVFYRGREARSLLLALSGRFQEDPKQILVRSGSCSSIYCVNPNHFFWGTRGDVALESNRRKGLNISDDIIFEIKDLRNSDPSTWTYGKIAEKYDISSNIVRSICTDGRYEITRKSKEKVKLDGHLVNLTTDLLQIQPKDHIMDYTNSVCPHYHKGNFGMQGQCLTCMKNIEEGKCKINLKDFKLKDYWLIFEFWKKVKIPKDKNTNECWVWEGNIKRTGETQAYFPLSPIHSSQSHSAPRVAFWLSRGFTGKLRINNKKSCVRGCCNPLHLEIGGYKITEPTSIDPFSLSYGNIFDQVKRQSDSEGERGLPDVPPHT